MGCGAAEATWALFVLLLSTLVCLSASRVDLGFFFINFPILHPIQRLIMLPAYRCKCPNPPHPILFIGEGVFLQSIVSYSSSFALKVGELSEIVSTDSGVHIILRTK